MGSADLVSRIAAGKHGHVDQELRRINPPGLDARFSTCSFSGCRRIAALRPSDCVLPRTKDSCVWNGCKLRRQGFQDLLTYRTHSFSRSARVNVPSSMSPAVRSP
jgi:hypothetical protein